MGSPGGHFAFDLGFSQGNLDHTTIAALHRKQQKQKKRNQLVDSGVGVMTSITLAGGGSPGTPADGQKHPPYPTPVEEGVVGRAEGVAPVDAQGQRRLKLLELNYVSSSVSALLMDNSALSSVQPMSTSTPSNVLVEATPSRPGSAPSNMESTPSFSKKPKSRSAMAVQQLRDLRASSPDPLLAHGYPRQQQRQGLGQGSGPGSYDGVHSTLASNNNNNSFGLSTVTRDLPWDPKDKHKGDKGYSNAHTHNTRPPGTPTPASTHPSTQPSTQPIGHSPSMNALPSSTPLPPPSLADLNLDPRLATLAKDLSPLHFETGHHHTLSSHSINTFCQATLPTDPINLSHPIHPHHNSPYQPILSTHLITHPTNPSSLPCTSKHRA